MKYDDGSYESAYIGHFERQHTLSSWFENLLNFLDTNEIQVGNKDIQLDIPKSHQTWGMQATDWLHGSKCPWALIGVCVCEWEVYCVS